MWLLPLIAFFIFGSISYLLRRYLAQHIHHESKLINLVFYVVFLLPAGIVGGLFLANGNLVPSISAVLALVAASLLWPLYYLASFRAAKDLDAGVLSMLADTSVIVTMVVSFFVFHERLSVLQIVGVFCLIFSGAVAAWPDIKWHMRLRGGGLAAAVVATVLLGLGVVIDKVAYSTAGLGQYLLYSWPLQALWMMIIARKDIKRIPKFLSKDNAYRSLVLLHGAVGTVRSLAFGLAILLSASVTAMNAASNFLSIAIIVAAYFVLKEREHLVYKFAGALLGLTGLYILA